MPGSAAAPAAKCRNCRRGSFILNLPLLTSFDHLVGTGEERRWHSNAKCIGGFHIDDQLETSWLLDRQIGGLGAFEDFVDVHGSLAKKVRVYRGVRHQPAFVDEPARRRACSAGWAER